VSSYLKEIANAIHHLVEMLTVSTIHQAFPLHSLERLMQKAPVPLARLPLASS
jgi:hypothetical protein